jgi:hypothetical protein
VVVVVVVVCAARRRRTDTVEHEVGDMIAAVLVDGEAACGREVSGRVAERASGRLASV